MTADELTHTMRAALEEEREGIRRLDHVMVTRAIRKKEAIINALLETPATDRGPLLVALDDLREDLRSNLTLLAHARAYFHDAAEQSRTPEGRSRLLEEHGLETRARRTG